MSGIKGGRRRDGNPLTLGREVLRAPLETVDRVLVIDCRSPLLSTVHCWDRKSAVRGPGTPLENVPRLITPPYIDSDNIRNWKTAPDKRVRPRKTITQRLGHPNLTINIPISIRIVRKRFGAVASGPQRINSTEGVDLRGRTTRAPGWRERRHPVSQRDTGRTTPPRIRRGFAHLGRHLHHNRIRTNHLDDVASGADATPASKDSHGGLINGGRPGFGTRRGTGITNLEPRLTWTSIKYRCVQMKA